MRRLHLLVLCCLVLGLPACGDEAPTPVKVEWRQSKRGAAIGRVRAAVVERPAPDRALIEARWENRSGAENCALELVVPEGVVVLEGERRMPISPEETAGAATWLVEFPTGREADAVLRFCAETEDGLRAAETSVRLAD